jgi:hypothetical protein
VYLLYWYKRTNTDTGHLALQSSLLCADWHPRDDARLIEAQSHYGNRWADIAEVWLLILLALLVRKYKY